MAVSYTHLDVYKRQPLCTSAQTAGLPLKHFITFNNFISQLILQNRLKSLTLFRNCIGCTPLLSPLNDSNSISLSASRVITTRSLTLSSFVLIAVFKSSLTLISFCSIKLNLLLVTRSD